MSRVSGFLWLCSQGGHSLKAGTGPTAGPEPAHPTDRSTAGPEARGGLSPKAHGRHQSELPGDSAWVALGRTRSGPALPGLPFLTLAGVRAEGADQAVGRGSCSGARSWWLGRGCPGGSSLIQGWGRGRVGGSEAGMLWGCLAPLPAPHFLGGETGPVAALPLSVHSLHPGPGHYLLGQRVEQGAGPSCELPAQRSCLSS